MKLWVDGQCFQTSSRNRGIGRYALDLLHGITEYRPEVELHLSLNAQMVPEAIAARRALSAIIPAQRIHLWHGAATGGESVEGNTANRRLSQISLVHHVNCLSPDVALSLSPFEGISDASTPLAPSDSLNVPLAGVFYDAIPFRFQDKYLPTENLRAVFQRRMEYTRGFDNLLCISEFALSEARLLFDGIHSLNISAGISDGFQKLMSQTGSVAREKNPPFLLYVGGLDWRKNLPILPQAFERLPMDMPLRLVLAGEHPAGNLNPILDQWRALGLPMARIESVGHVTDAELAALYRKATAVIQPSFMEGFGLTALEAMVSGTPVIAARAGALPEVVGSERLMFDPRSPEELAKRILDVCTDESLPADIAGERDKFLSRFNWKNTANLAVDGLARLVKPQAAEPGVADLRRRVLADLRAIPGKARSKAEALAVAERPAKRAPRLLVDASSTVRNQYKTGIQRVVRNISKHLAARRQVHGLDVCIAFCDDEQGWFEVPPDLPPKPDKRLTDRIRPELGDVILMLDSSWDLASTHHPFLAEARMRGAKVVTCIYDTVPIRLPGFCNPGMPPVFRDWLLGAMQYSTGFICISKAVADELKSLLRDLNYPHAVEIGHWRLGADFAVPHGTAQSEVRNGKGSTNFLMVGTLEPRKGQSLVVDAFDMGWQNGLDAHLTIVGKYGWEAEHLADRIRTHPEYRRRLHWLDQIEDDELLKLYADCDALISASFGEGFGLPIVEAGQLGVPVIASDIPVFREVSAASRHATFFETGSREALLQAVRKFIRTPPKISFSAPAAWPNWAQSADELVEVILGGGAERYEPTTGQPFLLPSDVGVSRASGPIDVCDQVFRMKLVSGPEPIGNDGSQKILVAITNLSKQPWFGRGNDDGSFGVAVSYHVRSADGAMLQYDNPRTDIILVLQPGDTHIVAVIIPGMWRRRGAALVEIELVQEGVHWWGNPLEVPLRPPVAHVPVEELAAGRVGVGPN